MARRGEIVKVDEFGTTLYKVCKTWCDSVPSATAKACDTMANKTKRKLAMEAEAKGFQHTKGSSKPPYAKCFKVKKAEHSGWKVLSAVVYNTKYSKTTWLENGHRISGMYANAKREFTSPRPHWSIAYEWAIDNIDITIKKFLDEIKF